MSWWQVASLRTVVHYSKTVSGECSAGKLGYNEHRMWLSVLQLWESRRSAAVRGQRAAPL